MNRIAGGTHSLLRIVAGLLFIFPGGLKILGWFGGMPPGVQMTPLLTIAGWLELGCGALILLGLFTRTAAFIASGEMAFAYFYGPWPILKGDTSASFWPIANGGELAVMFCFAFLLLATAGAGAWSADTRRRVGVGRRGATAGGAVTGRAAPRARGGMLSRFRRR